MPTTLGIVHDFPYRSLLGEVGVALSVAASLAEATRDHPEILPVYISLTSGEPTPEVQALLEGAGGIPILRGAREAERAIAGRAWWEARRADRLADGPVRSTWPALAADRTRFGHDGDGSDDGGDQPTRPGRTLSELDSLAFLRAVGIRVVEALPAADPAGAAAVARGRDGPFVVKLDAVGLAHKSDLDGVRLGLPGATEVEAAAGDLLELGRRAGLDVRGVLVEPMVPAGLELIVGLSRDQQFGPAVVVGFGGVFAEVLDDVAIRIAPVDRAAALAMLASLRGARSSTVLAGARRSIGRRWPR
jgi:acyl-CoA synthetase (NDP forming)